MSEPTPQGATPAPEHAGATPPPPATLLDGRLKLRHLVLVDALSENGTVVGAAAAMHVTQPVVTRSLQELESIVGARLYERGPRGVTPTEHGLVLTEHARAILAHVRIAGRHLQEVSDATRGEVRVGTHLAGSQYLVPRAVVRLSQMHPQLTVAVREASPEQLLVDLRAGRLDVIIGRLPDVAEADLDQRALVHDAVHLVVGARHPLADREHLHVDDLRGYRWIMPGMETRLRAELELWMSARGLHPPKGVIEATNFLTVRRLLVDTQRIAAMPGLLGEADESLRTLPIELGRVGDTIGVTLVRGRRLSPVAREMLRVVRAVADDLVAARPSVRLADVEPHPPGA